jgi:hypothetical protein
LDIFKEAHRLSEEKGFDYLNCMKRLCSELKSKSKTEINKNLASLENNENAWCTDQVLDEYLSAKLTSSSIGYIQFAFFELFMRPNGKIVTEVSKLVNDFKM